MDRKISEPQKAALLKTLQLRFTKNMHRHKNLQWNAIEAQLLPQAAKLWSLHVMEETGGEPDVIAYDESTHQYWFCDCAAQSPSGRRSLCYDMAALESRKEHKPKNSALEMATQMGIELLTEAQYLQLQSVENFDTKTSSWILTPNDLRKQGGALFGDFRFGRAFIYHNGAESYYAARAFRGLLKV
ncbi:MAG: DUF4256 domain-containing protein [Chitinophagales bacterium]